MSKSSDHSWNLALQTFPGTGPATTKVKLLPVNCKILAI